MEVIALAIDEGRVSARRAAGLLDLTLDDLAELFEPTGSKPRSICERRWRVTRPRPRRHQRHPGMLARRRMARACGGYGVETVEDCVIETQTGYQRRRPEQQIDAASFAGILGGIHRPATPSSPTVAVRAPDIALDVGERSLWAHTLTRNDAWVLCGPDKASLRFGVRLGLRDRLVSLEGLSARQSVIGRKEPLTDRIYRTSGLQRRSANSCWRRGQKSHDDIGRSPRPDRRRSSVAISIGPGLEDADLATERLNEKSIALVSHRLPCPRRRSPGLDGRNDAEEDIRPLRKRWKSTSRKPDGDGAGGAAGETRSPRGAERRAAIPAIVDRPDRPARSRRHERSRRASPGATIARNRRLPESILLARS